MTRKVRQTPVQCVRLVKIHALSPDGEMTMCGRYAPESIKNRPGDWLRIKFTGTRQNVTCRRCRASLKLKYDTHISKKRYV